MATIKSFEDLEIWQEARKISMLINAFCDREKLKNEFKFVNQLKSSSGSIMDNIAEGFERNGRREFIQFLSISKASAGELKSQLYRLYDCKHITQSEFYECKSTVESVGRKIGALIGYLQSSNIQGKKYK